MNSRIVGSRLFPRRAAIKWIVSRWAEKILQPLEDLVARMTGSLIRNMLWTGLVHLRIYGASRYLQRVLNIRFYVPCDGPGDIFKNCICELRVRHANQAAVGCPDTGGPHSNVLDNT